jgi:hypothetical protein
MAITHASGTHRVDQRVSTPATRCRAVSRCAVVAASVMRAPPCSGPGHVVLVDGRGCSEVLEGHADRREHGHLVLLAASGSRAAVQVGPRRPHPVLGQRPRAKRRDEITRLVQGYRRLQENVDEDGGPVIRTDRHGTSVQLDPEHRRDGQAEVALPAGYVAEPGPLAYAYADRLVACPAKDR